jgi:pimeloyl-ACP methyl ester carboxylesterase
MQVASQAASGEAFPYTVPEGFDRGDVDTGEVRLTYWRHGNPAVPKLLVLHGMTDWGLDWARFARRIGDRVECILLDQRGHGYSDKPEEGYTRAQMAEDAWRAIEKLGLERPAVLGHSMGGGVALALGAAHPEGVGRLVLVDPGVRIEADQAPRRQGSVEERRAGLKQRQALGRRALTEQLRAARPTFDPEDVANTVESTLLASPFVYNDARRPDASAQLAQLQALRCPTLVIRGEPARGATITDTAAQQIRELVPGDMARVVQIAGTGHLPQREAFELFVSLVLPFLTGDTASQEEEGGAPACFLHLLDEEGHVRSA